MTTVGLVRAIPALIFSLALIPATLHAGINLVFNPSFENVSPTGADTSFGPLASPPDGPTGAANWNTWNSTTGTTATQDCVNSSVDPLCAPIAFPGIQPLAIDGTHILHIQTNIANSGIYQAFDLPNQGAMSVAWSVWIYVVLGQVDVAIGNDGTTTPDQAADFTSGTGAWQQLSGFNTQNVNNAPANEITIYSVDRGAEFYVDAVSVSTPEPASIFIAASGLLLLAGRRRYRR